MIAVCALDIPGGVSHQIGTLISSRGSRLHTGGIAISLFMRNTWPQRQHEMTKIDTESLNHSKTEQMKTALIVQNNYTSHKTFIVLHSNA